MIPAAHAFDGARARSDGVVDAGYSTAEALAAATSTAALACGLVSVTGRLEQVLRPSSSSTESSPRRFRRRARPESRSYGALRSTRCRARAQVLGAGGARPLLGRALCPVTTAAGVSRCTGPRSAGGPATSRTGSGVASGPERYWNFAGQGMGPWGGTTGAPWTSVTKPGCGCRRPCTGATTGASPDAGAGTRMAGWSLAPAVTGWWGFPWGTHSAFTALRRVRCGFATCKARPSCGANHHA